MSQPQWTATLRKPIGVLAILAIITIWTIVVASASGWISTLHWVFQAVVYLVAGIVWILPLGPILRWMELGRAPR